MNVFFDECRFSARGFPSLHARAYDRMTHTFYSSPLSPHFPYQISPPTPHSIDIHLFLVQCYHRLRLGPARTKKNRTFVVGQLAPRRAVLRSSEIGSRAAAFSQFLDVPGRLRLGTMVSSIDAAPASGRSRARRALVTNLGFRASKCAQKARRADVGR